MMKNEEYEYSSYCNEKTAKGSFFITNYTNYTDFPYDSVTLTLSNLFSTSLQSTAFPNDSI